MTVKFEYGYHEGAKEQKAGQFLSFLEKWKEDVRVSIFIPLLTICYFTLIGLLLFVDELILITTRNEIRLRVARQLDIINSDCIIYK